MPFKQLVEDQITLRLRWHISQMKTLSFQQIGCILDF